MLNAPPLQPFISVVIPTYRRPDLLPRAVQSVLAQTGGEWELIVSDDEPGEGETWRYLAQLASGDPRVRVIKNHGPRGQSGNVNNGMRAAAGRWIKILFDDDMLLPGCLAAFARAARAVEGGAMISCRAELFVNGRAAKRPPSRPFIHVLAQKHAHLAMYLQEDVGLGTPTQCLARTDIIRGGEWFEEYPGLFSGVDTYWFMRVLKHGDNVIIDRPLVRIYQGEHETVTSQMTDARHDQEFALLRSLQFALINPELRPPPLATALQTWALIRSLHALSQRKWRRALQLCAPVRSPRAVWHFLRWMAVRSGCWRSAVPRRRLRLPASQEGLPVEP